MKKPKGPESKTSFFFFHPLRLWTGHVYYTCVRWKFTNGINFAYKHARSPTGRSSIRTKRSSGYGAVCPLHCGSLLNRTQNVLSGHQRETRLQWASGVFRTVTGRHRWAPAGATVTATTFQTGIRIFRRERAVLDSAVTAANVIVARFERIFSVNRFRGTQRHYLVITIVLCTWLRISARTAEPAASKFSNFIFVCRTTFCRSWRDKTLSSSIFWLCFVRPVFAKENNFCSRTNVLLSTKRSGARRRGDTTGETSHWPVNQSKIK